MTLQELFADESRWTQGQNYKTANGLVTGTPIAWCIRAAAYDFLTPQQRWKFVDFICARTGMLVTDANDDPLTTIDVVRGWVTEAGI